MAKKIKQLVILCGLLGGTSLFFATKPLLTGNEAPSSSLKDIKTQIQGALGEKTFQKRIDIWIERKVNNSSTISNEAAVISDRINQKNTTRRNETSASFHSVMKPEQDEWELEQTRRKEILSKTCRQHPEWNFSLETISRRPQLLWPFIYNDKYKVIYCTICKVASTAWKSAFLVLMGKYKTVEEVDLGQWYQLDRSLPTLAKLRDPHEIERRLKTYKKFIFVREPFSRALSGYRNKLYKRNKYYQKTVGTKTIRLLRKNPSKEALETGVGVTFSEFLQYLSRTTPQALDIHWRPMHTMTLPCAVDYDFIGHLETAAWDIENILNKTRIGEVVRIPKPASNLSGADNVLTSFYGDIDVGLMEATYRTFKHDFQLFGYSVPRLLEEKLQGTA